MSTRKSTRLESKPAIAFNGLDIDAVVDEDPEFAQENMSDSDHEVSADGGGRKRRKTGASSRAAGKNAKNVKGRRGKLGALPYVVSSKLYSCSEVPFLCRQRNATGHLVRGQWPTQGQGRGQMAFSTTPFYEQIFGHLRPYDILRLARTTKALRAILMQRSAISVWKEARANVEGLPDCPP
jgi:hypothetical protein